MNALIYKYLSDLLLWGAALLVAFAFRQPLVFRTGIPATVMAYVLLGVVVMTIMAWRYRLANQTWRKVNLIDLKAILQAAGYSTLILLALGFALRDVLQLPRSVPLVGGILGFLLMGGVRVAARFAFENINKQKVGDLRRVLIVGAGEAGTLLAREMQRHPEAGLTPVGFLDDDPIKLRQQLMGLTVHGNVDDLLTIAPQLKAQEILIAIPSATGEFVRKVVQLSRQAGLHYRIIPGMFELLSGRVSIEQIRDVDVEDLLRREPVTLDSEGIAAYLRNRVVLVTGAGGSIGSEIVRQVVEFQPRKVVLVGRGENSIFSVQQQLHRNWPDIHHVAVIGDVRDAHRLDAIFDEHRPEVVFHAAAHKHVPLMEDAPSEAILNNVIGTSNVAELCLKHGIARFVNVSTDKAVNPTSVMGASKRLAEMVVSAAASRTREGQAFVSVRFGNVLGSRGSVVPTFMAQIRIGGPVTVTHPEMVRYFMTIPEAARLVLQAGSLAENRKVYVLNMGQPVKIAELAKEVIRLSGAKDIDVVFTGIRPGEKLYEELLTSEEGHDATTHQEIFSARLEAVDPELLESNLMHLRLYAEQNNKDAIRSVLKKLIPEHKFGSIR